MLRILLDNALRHTPPGTGVRVSAARANGHVRLEVSDRGLGINRQNMPHIFEPFFTSNEQAQGAGLGLAIARELAERMQGRLTVRSGPGQDHVLAGPAGMRRLAALACAARASALPGCGDSDCASPTPTPAEAPTTRVEVVERAGAEGGFDAAEDLQGTRRRAWSRSLSLFGAEGGEGSGFVLNGEGEIVTNAHVVTTGEGDAIRARERGLRRVRGRQPREARVLGHDPNADIALLQVDPKGLTLRPLPLGDSEKVAVGEPVAAIGSPFGQAQSLSVGIVSAVDRAVASLTDFSISGAIQTDAAINPGNSGGPLVGADGARDRRSTSRSRSRSGGGEGVGFAVPIDVVKRSIGQLREDGRARYAYLGVILGAAVSAARRALRARRSTKGAWVQEVNPGGPAAAGRAARRQRARRRSRARRSRAAATSSPRSATTPVDERRRPLERDRPLQAGRDRPSRDPPRRRDADVKVKLGERPLGSPAECRSLPAVATRVDPRAPDIVQAL